VMNINIVKIFPRESLLE